jgi:hypothetical protein
LLTNREWENVSHLRSSFLTRDAVVDGDCLPPLCRIIPNTQDVLTLTSSRPLFAYTRYGAQTHTSLFKCNKSQVTKSHVIKQVGKYHRYVKHCHRYLKHCHRYLKHCHRYLKHYCHRYLKHYHRYLKHYCHRYFIKVRRETHLGSHRTNEADICRGCSTP